MEELSSVLDPEWLSADVGKAALPWRRGKADLQVSWIQTMMGVEGNLQMETEWSAGLCDVK